MFPKLVFVSEILIRWVLQCQKSWNLSPSVSVGEADITSPKVVSGSLGARMFLTRNSVASRWPTEARPRPVFWTIAGELSKVCLTTISPSWVHPAQLVSRTGMPGRNSFFSCFDYIWVSSFGGTLWEWGGKSLRVVQDWLGLGSWWVYFHSISVFSCDGGLYWHWHCLCAHLLNIKLWDLASVIVELCTWKLPL